jgi:hypothetical protein
MTVVAVLGGMPPVDVWAFHAARHCRAGVKE